MSPFNGDEETQVLESDSPSPGYRLGDGIQDQSTAPLVDTVPVGNLEKTEVVREDPTLYGETQALEDPDCGFGDGFVGIDEWAKTQVLDGYEDTAVLENGDDDETERTEVLSDGEGLSDDGATLGGHGSCGDGRTSGGEDGFEKGEQGKKESVVDSDASTDEECVAEGDKVTPASQLSGGFCKPNSGSVRRSFAAVRAASLRSSGLAAARSISPKTADAEPKHSLSNGENCKEQDHDAGDQAGFRPCGMETPNGAAGITHLDIKVGEIDWDHENENYQRENSKSRINNSRVRKLFNEITSPEKEETSTRPSSNTGKLDSPCSCVPDYAVAGLSYIVSQEPGDLSQANALDVVDKFISVNDLGLSQDTNTGINKKNDTNTGKMDIVKSPPVSSAKGVQCLAKKVDHRSPVGKEGVFEWIDSIEDEGGGEFFSRKKDSFFESKGGAWKSRSQPPKCRHSCSRMASGADDRSGQEDANPKTEMKRMSFARSDSRLILYNSSRNEKVHLSEAKTRKNLFKDRDEQSNSKSLQKLLEVADVRVEAHIYDVGPDTQIAAEAMEALAHESSINYEKDGAHPVAEKVPEIPVEKTTMRKTSRKDSLRKKASFRPDLDGISTGSKQRKVLHSKSRGGPSFSRSQSVGGKSSEDTIVKTKGKQKLNQISNVCSFITRNKSYASVKGDKERIVVDGTLIEEADKCHSSLTSHVQLSVSKEIVPGKYHVNVSPVAHRTRRTKAVNMLRKTEILSMDCGKDTNRLIDVSTLGDSSREDKLVADACEPLKSKRKGSNIISDRTAKVRRKFTSDIEEHDIGGLHEEEARMSSPTKDAFIHSKGRKVSQIISDNPKTNGNSNNSAKPIGGTEAKTKERKNKRIIVKSVSEILDTAKRKKRSAARISSKTDEMSFDSRKRKVPFISGVRTRSSATSLSSKPYLANDSKERLAHPDKDKAGLTDANIYSAVDMNCSVHPKDVKPPNQAADTISPVEVAEENAKQEDTPIEKLRPSGLSCMTPSKDKNAVSPVCVAQDPSRASLDRGLSRSSVARELLRLEATKTSPVCELNMRRRKDMASLRVLFSHHLDEDIMKQQKKIMARLGIPIASSISEATHFVTDKFVRTRNMLEAMALGKPVVTHMWLESCGQASCFIDEKNYILRDAKKEKEIGFSMPLSLARACQCPLLQDRRVFITPNAKPDQEVICSLVRAAHGKPLKRIGRSAMKDDRLPDDLLVLSCEEDYSVCIPLLEKGADVYSSELLLNGIVIQKLEFERHRLFLDHVRRTRSTIWLKREGGNQFLPVTKCT